MSLRPTSSPLHLHFFLVRPQNPNFLSRSLEFPEFRYHRRRRRRLKVSFSFHNFFNDLISNFPSSTSLDLIAPALGLASGAAALYFSRDRRFRKISDARQDGADIGNWILVTSPTPFNRFVLLRCPSISFVNDDAQLHLLEGINDRLVKEERHFVNWNRGRIFLPGPGPGPVGSNTGLEDELVYQRVCISAGDGGMISLDWPANLDLAKEHGLDTTVLIVPGTAEGSMDSNIRSLVGEVLVRGCFPVVMNPRGCAGSPLTTARLGRIRIPNLEL